MIFDKCIDLCDSNLSAQKASACLFPVNPRFHPPTQRKTLFWLFKITAQQKLPFLFFVTKDQFCLLKALFKWYQISIIMMFWDSSMLFYIYVIVIELLFSFFLQHVTEVVCYGIHFSECWAIDLGKWRTNLKKRKAFLFSGRK